ncbi:MAG: 2-C-methyl-D-erythritol 2,4-cyclodiphosphate synthase [Candidatus Omnitrophica bacterium]|nr:2-C-methyl-D-erythritol 2,4-cyclodiphosphate synthase [Candidatus Omnitrophota bacterium]
MVMNFRTGIGFDVHRLVSGRKLFLGGIEIPYHLGLDGHSDADVVMHALCDAILGASGKGDIGEHFPNTDPRYKNISSSLLLKRVNELANDDGYKVSNVDVMILAENPKLAEFKAKMKFHIAFELAIDETQVNIKAGTNEGLGFIGKGEAIACYATVLLKKD